MGFKKDFINIFSIDTGYKVQLYALHHQSILN